LFAAGNGWERLFGYSGEMDSMTAMPAKRISPARDAQLWLSAFEASASRGALLLLIGIRDLKQVNDLHGRETGNAVIAEIGKRIAGFAPSISGAILTARLPGREFLIIAGACGQAEAEQVARKLLGQLEAPLQHRDGELHISPRIGIALSRPGQSGTQLLAAASSALSAAYSHKGRKYRFADSVTNVDTQRNSRLDKGLRQALKQQEIAIYFQPQFEVDTEKLVGAEALARWTHPDFGEIGAEELFAAADRCDLREELSYAIQKQAVGYATQWPDSLHLSINLGAEELADDHAIRLLAILEDSGFPFNRLTVELTEESIIRDFDIALSQLEVLRAKGIGVAIDDFGTGYSSLAYLKSLPLDYLKIDKGMTADISGNPRDLIVLRAIIALGKALGLRIIAEGVEKVSELELLRSEGCDYFQGYLRAPPLTAEQFLKFIHQ
jgi:diguanylate cyclase (GGDEF)-like protein